MDTPFEVFLIIQHKIMWTLKVQITTLAVDIFIFIFAEKIRLANAWKCLADDSHKKLSFISSEK